MHLHPQLRALRGDDAPQRAAQASLSKALNNWRESAQIAALRAELARFDGQCDIDRFPLLSGCFGEGDGSGRVLLGGLVDAMAEALGDEPLGHVPMRHFTDGTVSSLLIAAEGGTTISVIAIDGQAFRRKPPASAVSFADNQCHECILAGRATGTLIEAEAAGSGRASLSASALELREGVRLHRDSRRQAVILREVEGRLVTLRLQHRPAAPEPTREYALADGRLLSQAAGNARESRHELAAVLLGRMGRKDAAPLLAAMAQEQASDALRWQALRECLGLDTALGFATVTALARDSGDSLAGPAGAMRAQLLEHYPILAEVAECPV